MIQRFLLVFCFCLFSLEQTVAQHSTESTFYGHTLADEGAWCWFADPRALHFESKDKTVSITLIGYIDRHGNIKARQIDWKTGLTEEVLVRSYFQPDDHDNPAFLVLPDERIMIIYSRHSDEKCFYYRISRRPGDISALGEEKRLEVKDNTTYPNPFILSEDPDHIYMCWRGMGWHPTIAQMTLPDKDDNISFTWGPMQLVQSTAARPYAKYASNGRDKIYIAYTTGHPDNEYPNWLYLNVFNIRTRRLQDIQGHNLSIVDDGPFQVKRTDDYFQDYAVTVVDRMADSRDWIWSLQLDEKESPAIGFTRISQDKMDHEYYYATFDGGAWRRLFIAEGGRWFHNNPTTELCYSAGMAINPANTAEIYCSVPVNNVYEIQKYTLSDDRATILSCQDITWDSPKGNVRPYYIPGTQDTPLKLVWMNGDYRFWIVSKAYPKAFDTSIRGNAALPHGERKAMKKKTVKLHLNDGRYTGNLITLGNLTYGVDAETLKPYLLIGEDRWDSQNKLATSDTWATGGDSRTNGLWMEPQRLSRCVLTFSYDPPFLTVYRDGIIDMHIDVDEYGKHYGTNNYRHLW
ncbi:MAG: BNR repeat-containing protein [Bacteroidaceae bacterium]|nr:BNR repeat-containing protein [Bacteroidaceae bacterium]